MADHQDEVKASFTKQAPHFSSPLLTLSNQEYIRWVVERLRLNRQMRVLDVACGTGIVSRALAPLVESVTGIDVTSAMLTEGRRIAEREGLRNLEFRECPAESIAFPPETFDLSITRFSLHHFEAPIIQVREMARVTKPGGSIVVIDLVAPSDPALAGLYNNYERLRDPSHTVALSGRQLEDLVFAAGIPIRHVEKIQVSVSVERWLDLTDTPSRTRERIVTDLEGELAGRSASTGLSPSRDENGDLTFRQEWVLIVGTKA
jgi:ubiquinone/menaquinone biosynthesis C-methylase UbiE